jgi:hypothetical protein
MATSKEEDRKISPKYNNTKDLSTHSRAILMGIAL